MTFVVLGNPENRRVQFFQNALVRFQQPPAVVISWRDALYHPGTLAARLQPGVILRIDSPGENFAVEQAFLALGAEEPDETGTLPRITRAEIDRLIWEKGRILYPRQWYLGFRRMLRNIQAMLPAIPGIRVTHPPGDIEMLCDKRVCHQYCRKQALPVPLAFGAVGSFAELCQQMAAARINRVFVKLANGSSASGVIALETNGKVFQAQTSVELVQTAQGVKLYNSLKIRRYRNLREIALMVDAICREGAQIEQWLPKAGWQGQRCDLRIVVIAGVARHAVLRLSHSPMTNLHLGNQRGNLAEFLAEVGAERWSQAQMVCQRAATAFPASLQLGVDLLVAPGFKRWTIAEINAFGDLLPNVRDHGLDTYEAQVAQCLTPPTQGGFYA